MSNHGDMTDRNNGKGVGPLRQSFVHQVFAHRVFNKLRGDGLRARALRGSGWTMAGFGSQQVMRLGSNLILTRLLVPEVFGLISLAYVFITGLQMFSDIGIKPSIIQSRRGEDVDFLNTAWTLGVIRGVILWSIACIIAYPVSAIYGEPMLFPILCVIGSTAAIRGFQTNGYATSNRKLRLGKLTLVELVSQVAGIALTISWAAVSPTAWSIAAGGVLASVLSVLLGHHALNEHKHRFRLEKRARKELVSFGKWILLSSSITFFAQSGDRLFLPKILDIISLSYYAIAMVLAQIPTQIFGQLATKVLFPVYSEAANEGGPERVGRAIKKFAAISSYVYLVPLSVLFLAVPLIDILYDERYWPAGSVLSLLAISSYLRMMRTGQDGLLLAIGDSRSHMIVNMVRIATWLPIATYLASIFGLEGFCVGIVIADAVTLIVQRLFIGKKIGYYSRASDRALLLVLMVAVAIKSIFLSL